MEEVTRQAIWLVCGAHHADAVAEGAGHACRRNLDKHVKLVIGCPMLSSAGNAAFWLRLCGASGQEGASALVNSFSQAEAEGDTDKFCFNYNRSLVEKVCQGVVLLYLFQVQALQSS